MTRPALATAIRGVAHRALLPVAGSLCLATVAAAQAPPPYKRADLPTQQRVADLLSRMTLEEKIAQLQGQAPLPDLSGERRPTAIAVIKRGQVDDAVARRVMGNGIGSFTNMAFGPLPAPRGAEQQNLIQRWLVEHTRLGIPALFQAEALHGLVADGATSFPQATALGATWDESLIRQVFDIVGRESRAAGMAQVLAPVLDLARDPRFGRVEEMYSEDPYLVGTLGVAAVRGLQGTAAGVDGDHVIATAKHFVHGQPENGTNIGPSDYSERTMRERFLPPFERVVKDARIGAVMPSYNEIEGGIPSHANRRLLRDVLRGEWSFGGMVVSDWGGIPELHTKQRVAPTLLQAGVAAMNAGVDMELPTAAAYATLAESVRAGKVRMRDVDAAVTRVLTAKFALGLFELPYADPARTAAIVGEPAHAALARKAADEAIVLLRNEGGILPLDPASGRSVAVIGPNADAVRLGTYSGTPPHFVSVLAGIRKRLGARATVTHAEGVRISEPDTTPLTNRLMPFRPPSEERDRRLIAKAVETARRADVIVLALGGNEAVSREAFGLVAGRTAPALGDADTLELPGRQNDLVRAIAALGKPVVAVLLGGRTYSAAQLDRSVPAIVQGWYLGQETGDAVAGVVFGNVNPSGKLPVTIARNVGQLPVFYDRKPPARLGYVGSDNTPLYPFGHGLSYTRFAYAKPVVSKPTIGLGGSTQVSVTVRNVGARDGDEIVQLYIHPHYSSVVQPVLRLAGFRRISIAAGASATVSFEVGPRELSIVDSQMRRTVEAGTFDILVGRSSADLQAVTLTVAP